MPRRPMRIPVADAIQILQEVCRGVDPSSLGLSLTPEGRLDLREIAIPGLRSRQTASTTLGPVPFVSRKPTLKACHLRRVDLSGASLADTIWKGVIFEDTKLARARVRGVTFASGAMSSVDFAGADLRDSAWGQYGVDGPVIEACDFTDADLSGSHYSHPLFVDCKFVRTKMAGIDFRGARFERCTFEGRFVELWFNRRFADPDPEVAALENRLKGVDFSKAELIRPRFLGIDLGHVKLPTAGYLHVSQPQAVFSTALSEIEHGWEPGAARKMASDYLRRVTANELREDVPLFLLREADFLESRLGVEVGARVLGEIRRAMNAPR